jgi:DNA-directed RNA polymerase specialized sigma24 family protein
MLDATSQDGMDAAPNHSNQQRRREEELAALLIGMAPLLRSRIRARRGKRLGHIGTSDIYASVTRRALEIEQSEGLASLPQRGAPTGTGPTVRSESAPSSEPAPRGLWTLLLLLVDRVIVDAKRRERAQQRAAEQSSQARAAREHGGPEHIGPEQAALSADEQAMLRTLVGQLSDQDRELVALRLSGRTWPDIATTLGWTPANCRQRWHRLVGQLAEALGETHGDIHE